MQQTSVILHVMPDVYVLITEKLKWCVWSTFTSPVWTVTGCWSYSPNNKWHIHYQRRQMHWDKGAVRCSPFLRCSALLSPMILIKVSSSVPNLPSPAANRSWNGRETLVGVQQQLNFHDITVWLGLIIYLLVMFFVIAKMVNRNWKGLHV